MSDSLQPHGLEPLFLGFSKQEYWSGLPLPSPRDLPNPGIKSGSPALKKEEEERKTYFIAHGTPLNVMCQPGWEGGLGENGYVYTYG